LPTPRFSIITPTRNRRDWIRRCIRSVQNQTFEDWEQIILDVGDEDETVADLIPDDPRIKYHRAGCLGPAGDFQTALDLASGEIVTPLSDDDRLPRHALQTVHDKIGANEWLNGRTVIVDTQGEPLHFRGGTPDHIEKTRDGEFMLGGAIYWRRELTQSLGGFNTEYDGAADLDLYGRFLTHTDPIRCGEILYLHTAHDQQDSMVNQARQADAVRRINAARTA
jgi:glycosyltransferase involved in cell wall biosynthesis